MIHQCCELCAALSLGINARVDRSTPMDNPFHGMDLAAIWLVGWVITDRMTARRNPLIVFLDA